MLRVVWGARRLTRTKRQDSSPIVQSRKRDDFDDEARGYRRSDNRPKLISLGVVVMEAEDVTLQPPSSRIVGRQIKLLLIGELLRCRGEVLWYR